MKKMQFTYGQGVVCENSEICDDLLFKANANGFNVYNPHSAVGIRAFYWDGVDLVRCGESLVKYKMTSEEFMVAISGYESGDRVQVTKNCLNFANGSILTICSKLSEKTYICTSNIRPNENYFININNIRLYEAVRTFVPLTAFEIKEKLSGKDTDKYKSTAMKASENIVKNSTYGAFAARCPISDFLTSVKCSEDSEMKRLVNLKIKKAHITNPKQMEKYIIPADLLRRMYQFSSIQLRNLIRDNVQPFTGEVYKDKLDEIVNASKNFDFEQELITHFPDYNNQIKIHPRPFGENMFKSTDADFLLMLNNAGKYKDCSFRISDLFNWEIVRDETNRLCLIPKRKCLYKSL